MNQNQKNKLYNLFQQLHRESYERHPTTTIKYPEILFDQKPSDCQDRSYALAEYSKNYLNLNPKFLWLCWYKEKLDSHVVVLFEDKIWDATWKRNNKSDYWDYPIDIYLEEANPDFKLITPYWVRKIIR